MEAPMPTLALNLADGVVAYEAAIGAVPAGHTLTLQHGARVIRSSEVAR